MNRMILADTWNRIFKAEFLSIELSDSQKQALSRMAVELNRTKLNG